MLLPVISPLPIPPASGGKSVPVKFNRVLLELKLDELDTDEANDPDVGSPGRVRLNCWLPTDQSGLGGSG
jgi:hypothetical protein